jgi:hypothetical protein
LLVRPRGNDSHSRRINLTSAGARICKQHGFTCHSAHTEYRPLLADKQMRFVQRYCDMDQCLRCGLGGSANKVASEAAVHANPAHTSVLTKCTYVCKSLTPDNTVQAVGGAAARAVTSAKDCDACTCARMLKTSSSPGTHVTGTTYHSSIRNSKAYVHLWNKIVSIQF